MPVINMSKGGIIPILKVGLASALIYWLVASGKFDLNSLQEISSPLVWFVGVALFFVVLFLTGKRWQLLLRFENVDIEFKEILKLSLIGIFFNFFMPGGVGGDVVKASYVMKDHKDKKWFVGWSILVDRILGMLALLLYSAVSGLLFSSHLSEKMQASFYSLSLLIVMGFVALVAILIFSPKKNIENLLKSHPILEKVLVPLFYFFREPKKVLLPFLISILSQGVVISIGCFVMYTLQKDISIWIVMLLFPFGFLATIVPIAPAGVGVGQAAFYYLFQNVTGDGNFGVLVITFYQAVQFLVGLLGGLLFVLYKKKKV